MKTLLFITHESTRTGAPIMLLYLLQYIQANQLSYTVDVLSLKEGVLAEAFKARSRNYYQFSKPKTQPSFAKRVLQKFQLIEKKEAKNTLVNTLASQQYDVVYSNTILSIPFGAEIAKACSAKHIAHIHELSAIIKLKLPHIKSYDAAVHQYIAASNLVKDTLINQWQIPKEKLKRVYEFSEVEQKEVLPKANQNFVVGGSGTVHWRKGSDIFIQVARYITTHYTDAKVDFVWVGNIPKNEQIILQEDLRKLGLEQTVKFIGEVDNPQYYYTNFDVFLMTSREDPFPLVCIEVGQLGKPIICFKDATGTEEIITNGGGFIVPYLNIEAMAEKVMLYFSNSELKEAHGAINEKAFLEFSVENGSQQIVNIIVSALHT